MRAIAFHLARLAAHEHVNKMSLNNLKLILSPTLRLSPGFLGALVGEREALFGGGNDGASLSFSVRICDARRADAAPSCLCRWSRTTSRRCLLGLHLGTVRRRRLDVVRLSFDEPLLRRRQVARHRRAAPLPLARPHLHFLPLNPTLADAPLVQQLLDPDLDALRLAATDAHRRPLCLGIDVARVVRRPASTSPASSPPAAAESSPNPGSTPRLSLGPEFRTALAGLDGPLDAPAPAAGLTSGPSAASSATAASAASDAETLEREKEKDTARKKARRESRALSGVGGMPLGVGLGFVTKAPVRRVYEEDEAREGVIAEGDERADEGEATQVGSEAAQRWTLLSVDERRRLFGG